tara:strand:- start:176 stop:466 length:291 start_codon:yes stop_codon:yes gene_type:complete
MKNNFIIILVLFFFITACAGNTKRSDKADEFLIEKKNPLVMPPDIDDLPKPKGDLKINDDDFNFKKKLKSQKKNTTNSVTTSSGDLQESIIKKIEQ